MYGFLLADDAFQSKSVMIIISGKHAGQDSQGLQGRRSTYGRRDGHRSERGEGSEGDVGLDFSGTVGGYVASGERRVREGHTE
jgi:hypothetical protein